MAYKRKTKDEYVLLSNYGHGWDEELTEDTWKEMKQRLKEYRENCPQYSFKYKKKRIALN